jgi:hypothetical protein
MKLETVTAVVDNQKKGAGHERKTKRENREDVMKNQEGKEAPKQSRNTNRMTHRPQHPSYGGAPSVAELPLPVPPSKAFKQMVDRESKEAAFHHPPVHHPASAVASFQETHESPSRRRRANHINQVSSKEKQHLEKSLQPSPQAPPKQAKKEKTKQKELKEITQYMASLSVEPSASHPLIPSSSDPTRKINSAPGRDLINSSLGKKNTTAVTTSPAPPIPVVPILPLTSVPTALESPTTVDNSKKPKAAAAPQETPQFSPASLSLIPAKRNHKRITSAAPSLVPSAGLPASAAAPAPAPPMTRQQHQLKQKLPKSKPNRNDQGNDEEEGKSTGGGLTESGSGGRGRGGRGGKDQVAEEGRLTTTTPIQIKK